MSNIWCFFTHIIAAVFLFHLLFRRSSSIIFSLSFSILFHFLRFMGFALRWCGVILMVYPGRRLVKYTIYNSTKVLLKCKKPEKPQENIEKKQVRPTALPHTAPRRTSSPTLSSSRQPLFFLTTTPCSHLTHPPNVSFLFSHHTGFSVCD